jgi:hypothetical protein
LAKFRGKKLPKIKDEKGSNFEGDDDVLAKLRGENTNEMNPQTFAYAIFHSFYFYTFLELIKFIFLPLKDIILLTLRINFIKTFSVRAFCWWLGFELFFPILVQEIEKVDSLKKKYLNLSV